jgi:hypothetical protein
MITDSAVEACVWVGRISSVGVLISTAEMFCIRRYYGCDSLFSWAIHRSRSTQFLNSRLMRIYDRLFVRPGLSIILFLRIFGALACLLSGHLLWLFLVGSVLVAAASNLLTLRGPDGRSGSDQLMCITFTALVIASVAGSERGWVLAAFFLGGQLVLSYGTSGYVKIMRPQWRTGEYLRGVIRTETYGHKGLFNFVERHPHWTKYLSLAFVLFECSLPMTLVLPPPVAEVSAVGVIFFHSVNAKVMGLNNFFWAFCGLIPAYLYTNHRVWCFILGP